MEPASDAKSRREQVEGVGDELRVLARGWSNFCRTVCVEMGVVRLHDPALQEHRTPRSITPRHLRAAPASISKRDDFYICKYAIHNISQALAKQHFCRHYASCSIESEQFIKVLRHRNGRLDQSLASYWLEARSVLFILENPGWNKPINVDQRKVHFF